MRGAPVNAGVDELDVAISGNHMMDTTNVPARMSILINFMYRVNECIAFSLQTASFQHSANHVIGWAQFCL
jgi:hypothetical protein